MPGKLSSASVRREGRGLGKGSMVRISPVSNREKQFPPWNTFESGGMVSTGKNDLVGSNIFISIRTETPLRAANLGTSFLLYLIINSKLLCSCGSTFLGQTSTSYSAARPSSRGLVHVHAVLGP